MKYINFKRYKFFTIFKNIKLKRYNFLKIFNYLDITRYNFSKAFNYLDIRRYNFSRFLMIFDIRRYNFAKVYKYFTFKKYKAIPFYLLGLFIFSFFTYLIIPFFFNYDKKNVENVICEDVNLKCSINGNRRYSVPMSVGKLL